MSPMICACVLCGATIDEWPGTVSWSNQFRGLYSGPEGLVLTGIGVYDDPRRGVFVASPDSNVSGDSYEPSDDDAFGVNQQLPRNGRHGFLFHGACWALLERYFQPNPVPQSRIFEVLKSLPFPLGSTAINWGHNYGNLPLLEDEDFYPWEDWKLYLVQVEPDHVIDRCDPYEISTDIVSLLALVPDHEKTPAQNHSLDNIGTAVNPNRDCFDRLPVELCLAIASCLPTSDALHARMASRAFWPIFYDQHFWATRFQPGSVDRSWLFEFRGERYLDWRWLYRQTNRSRVSSALSNRRRVWTLLEHMAKIVELQGHGLMPPSTSPVEPQYHLASHSDLSVRPVLASIAVSGDLKHLKPGQALSNFDRGCRILYKRKVHIPKNLKRITIFTVDVGGTYYIAGLVFTSTAGKLTEVGYSSNFHATDSVEVSRLCGFHIALGGKGIYGLRCAVEGGEQTRWLGNVGESLRTERLAHSDCPLEKLELGFDGCKLTSISACLPTLSKETVPKHDALRTAALWYPEVPCSSMDLNESSLIPRAASRYLSGFQPLIFAHFGGQDGKYLRHLTGINIEGWYSVCRLGFSYDNDINVPRLGQFRAREPLNILHFALDGPGGEAIVALDAVYATHIYTSGGYMTSLVHCEITTNRGRSCSFPHEPTEPDPRETVETVHMSAVPGTMITGFYGMQNLEYGVGLESLGIVTEQCDAAGFE